MTLAGIAPLSFTGGFCPHRFRPVYRPRIGAFDHLLAGSPRELEPA
jgi:hypothetical protein